LEALRLLTTSTNLRDKLEANTRWFRKAMTDAGFDILPGIHPIVPIMLGNAAFASNFADAMLDRGVYVIGFSYPVVPEGKARIRTQISAAHTQADLEMAVAAFIDTRDQLNV
jgi:glycine C-acetyltransferase